MSHIPLRKENDCLNCGATVNGRYCHQCGQENIVPHETFWHMVKHFVFDITHFDSKFFDSMRLLITKPGFLPQEYVKGRRASYLNPVKKYVFTSAIFFLLFFSFFVKIKETERDNSKPLTLAERQELIKGVLPDTANSNVKKMIALLNDTASGITYSDLAKYQPAMLLLKLGRTYRDKKQYDSAQSTLKPSERDSWFTRQIYYKNFKVNEKYGYDPSRMGNKLLSIFLHKLPYLLFVSLPVFALLLKLLYFRHKKIYYADHGIFGIYHYIFTFMLLLVVFIISKLEDVTHWGFLNAVMLVVFLYGGIYLYKSMKRFYQQKMGKTLLKFLLLNLAGFLMISLLFIVFVLLSIFDI